MRFPARERTITKANIAVSHTTVTVFLATRAKSEVHLLYRETFLLLPELSLVTFVVENLAAFSTGRNSLEGLVYSVLVA